MEMLLKGWIANLICYSIVDLVLSIKCSIVGDAHKWVVVSSRSGGRL